MMLSIYNYAMEQAANFPILCINNDKMSLRRKHNERVFTHSGIGSETFHFTTYLLPFELL
jgi:hypothetical protein